MIVQCQRSARVLDVHHEVRPGLVVCPGPPWAPECVGGELYVRLDDRASYALISEAVAYACQRLTAVMPNVPSLWAGEGPETIRLPGGDLAVYVGRDTNAANRAFQVAHEVTHAALAPTDAQPIKHWSHEMLATLISVDFLHHQGRPDLAELQHQYLTGLDRQATPARAMSYEGHQGEHVYYGPLYRLGRTLSAVVGWDEVVRRANYDGRGPSSREDWDDLIGNVAG